MTLETINIMNLAYNLQTVDLLSLKDEIDKLVENNNAVNEALKNTFFPGDRVSFIGTDGKTEFTGWWVWHQNRETGVVTVGERNDGGCSRCSSVEPTQVTRLA